MTAALVTRAAVRGWAMTEYGSVLHAVSDGRALCGPKRARWYPLGPAADLCAACSSSYGPGFPAPPGHVHHSIGLPWFADYAERRADIRPALAHSPPQASPA